MQCSITTLLVDQHQCYLTAEVQSADQLVSGADLQTTGNGIELVIIQCLHKYLRQLVLYVEFRS